MVKFINTYSVISFGLIACSISGQTPKTFSAAYESAVAVLQLKTSTWNAQQAAKKAADKIEADRQKEIATKKALDYCLVAQKLYNEEFLKELQEKVKTSPLRMKDWSTAHSLSEKEMIEVTDCYRSAAFILQAMGANFTPTSVIDAMQYSGSYGNFVHNNGGNYTHEVAQKLFDQSDEHLLFYVETGRIEGGVQTHHGFVIEKLHNGQDKRWRIYQSFFHGFTLAQWLGIDKWPKQWVYKQLMTHVFDAQYKKYGNGKIINEEELHGFILSHLYHADYIDKMHRTLPTSVDYIMPPYFYCGMLKCKY